MPMIVFAGQPTVLSTMKIGSSGAHVGLDTYTVESIRLLPGLSCDNGRSSCTIFNCHRTGDVGH
jgi:hypothetical protein